MECAMVQDNARNYAHCPPKKRPLAFYSAQADDHGKCAMITLSRSCFTDDRVLCV